MKGNYQLRVTSLFLDGKGKLWQEYIESKEKLDKEGIFLPAHKKEIPAMPKTIGILSSLEGAVIHDICNILYHLYIIYTSLVSQGGRGGPRGAGAAGANQRPAAATARTAAARMPALSSQGTKSIPKPGSRSRF